MATEVDTQQKLADHEKRLQDVEAFVREKRAAEQAGREREAQKQKNQRDALLWSKIEALKALKDDGCKTVDDVKKLGYQQRINVEDQYRLPGFIDSDLTKNESGSLDDIIKKYGNQMKQ